MSIKTKFAAIALAAVATVGNMSLTTTPAQAGNKGLAIGLGFAAGALLASNAAYGYGYHPVVRRCWWTTRYNAYGYPYSFRVCG